MLAPARSRSAVFFGLRGTRPALAGKLWTGWSFRAVREGGFNRFQCSLRPDPAPLYFFGLRGIRPALAGKLWKGWSFRAVREGGFDRFQCLLRPDPAPLYFFGLRGPAPELAGRLQGKMRFLRCAPEIMGVCLQRSFRRGPAAAAVCGARGCPGSAGVMSESELGVVFGKGLSGGRLALHSLGRLLRFSSLFHRLTLRIKLLPGPIPVLSYGFNC